MSSRLMHLARLLAIVGVMVLVSVAPTAALAAEPVAAIDLIESSENFSGVEVTVTGELVGDYGHRRGGWSWVQINDDSYAVAPLRDGGAMTGSNIGIGARLPERLIADLDPPGGYSRRGPLVSLTGTWRHHDPGRGGESYLDVTTLTVGEPGRPLTDDAAIAPRLIAATVLWAAVAAIWVRHRRPR